MVLSGGLCVGWSSPPALVQSLLQALPWQLQKCKAFPLVCLRTIIFFRVFATQESFTSMTVLHCLTLVEVLVRHLCATSLERHVWPISCWKSSIRRWKQTRSSWLNCALRDEAVYWVSIGHYEAVAVGNWWYWVSTSTCLYILQKVEIWSDVTDALQTHWQTLEDRAT